MSSFLLFYLPYYSKYSPPLQSPQDLTHGVAKKKPRTSSNTCSKTPCFFVHSNDKLVKSLWSSLLLSRPSKAKTQKTTSMSHTTDADNHVPYDHPFQTVAVLIDVATEIRVEATSEAAPSCATRERRSDVSRSRNRRANANASSDLAADHQPPLPPTAPQAGRTWRDVYQEATKWCR